MPARVKRWRCLIGKKQQSIYRFVGVRMNDLIIIGASGFGRETAWLVERINQNTPKWNLLGFIDDNPERKGTRIGGYPVLGGCEITTQYPDAYYVCAIGSAKIRKAVVERVNGIIDAKYAVLIDPSVLCSDRVTVGEGSIVCAGVIMTVDIEIGKHVILNLDCTVGHDAVINDYVTVYPSVNISGITTVGKCVEIGTGTQIIQGKTIGDESIIGAGAVIVKDIPAKCTAVGNPAKPIKWHD